MFTPRRRLPPVIVPKAPSRPLYCEHTNEYHLPPIPLFFSPFSRPASRQSEIEDVDFDDLLPSLPMVIEDIEIKIIGLG